MTTGLTYSLSHHWRPRLLPTRYSLWTSQATEAISVRASAPGTLTYWQIIVQDLPDTIQNARTLPGVEFMVHSFFQSHPVKGAKAYYPRTVFHDSDADQPVEVLRNLIPAISKESLIIIDDIALPDTGSAGDVLVWI